MGWGGLLPATSVRGVFRGRLSGGGGIGAGLEKTTSEWAATADVILLLFCFHTWAWNKASVTAHRQKKKTSRFWEKK
jgi:hypothetical protein